MKMKKKYFVYGGMIIVAFLAIYLSNTIGAENDIWGLIAGNLFCLTFIVIFLKESMSVQPRELISRWIPFPFDMVWTNPKWFLRFIAFIVIVVMFIFNMAYITEM